MLRWLRLLPCLSLLLLTASCGDKPTTMEEFLSRPVTLPDGHQIRAEVVTSPVDMAKGLMFRASLGADKGMLFLHSRPGSYAYWMYQTKIPLDIIWMDKQHQVVEVVAGAPPCASKSAKECPLYGGKVESHYVLQVNAGQAAKHQVTAGSRIQF